MACSVASRGSTQSLKWDSYRNLLIFLPYFFKGVELYPSPSFFFHTCPLITHRTTILLVIGKIHIFNHNVIFLEMSVSIYTLNLKFHKWHLEEKFRSAQNIKICNEKQSTYISIISNTRKYVLCLLMS